MNNDPTSDTTEATRLLRLVRPKGPHCIVAIYADKDSQRVAGDEGRNAVTRIVRTASEARAFLAKYDGRANLHYIANPLRWEAVKEKPGADLLTAIEYLHVDIDCGESGKAETLERLQGFDAPGLPTLVIDSGGGLQALWRLDRPIGDIEDAKAANRALVHALDGDPACVNPVHLLRLPGPLNLPNEKKRQSGRVPVPARLLLKDKQSAWPAESFGRAEAPSGDADYAFAPELVDDLSALNLPPTLIEIITDGRAKGMTLDGDDSRSAWAYYAAKEMVKHGVPVPVIAGILLSPEFSISESVLDREDPEREAIRTAARARASAKEWERMQRENAVDKLPAEANEPGGLESSYAESLRWREPKMIIDGLLPYNAFVQNYGARKSQKTFIMLDMGLRVATGTPYHGLPVKRAVVTYIAAEGSKSRFRDRVTAWLKINGVDPAELNGWFYMVNRPVDLTDARARRAFIDGLRGGRKRGLICFDTLSKNSGGVDEDTRGMKAFCHGANDVRLATGATVLVVHHEGKDAERKGRGSTVLPGDVDLSLRTARGRNGLVTLTVDEARDFEEGAALTFELKKTDIGNGEFSAAVCLVRKREAGEALTADETVLLRIASAYGGLQSLSDLADPNREGMSRSNVGKIVARLRKRGLVEPNRLRATRSGEDEATQLGAVLFDDIEGTEMGVFA